MQMTKVFLGLVLLALMASATRAQIVDSSSYYTFPRTFLNPGSDMVIEFEHRIVMGEYQGTPLRADGRFGNFAMVFTLDTQYVDMMFVDTNGDLHLLSEITQNNFALTLNGWLSYSGMGTPAGTVQITTPGRVFKVSLLGAPGTSLSNTSPLVNPFHSGDGSPLMLLVHGQNLLEDCHLFPDRSYQVFNHEGTSTGNSFLRTQRTGDTFQRNFRMYMVGGDFYACPEPASLFAVSIGLVGLFALRKRQR
jgi:hypothetical protein